MLKNTASSYGFVAKTFHWLMAALLIGMFIVAYIMTNIPRSDFRFSLYDLHKATGVLLFGLVVLRFSWRLANIQPALAASIPRWQRLAAKTTILSLYFFMVAMPVTGFFASSISGHDVSFYHLFTIPSLGQDKVIAGIFSQAHELFSYLLIAAFTLHVLGALYHLTILKDAVFKKMV